MTRLIFVSLFVLILKFGTFAQSPEFSLGIRLAKSGDFQTALQYFQKSIDKNLSARKLARIHYNIGVCFYQLKEAKQAVAAFREAIKLDSNYEKAFYALGMAQTDLKHWGEAEKAFLQSLTLVDGRNGEAWFDLALVLYESQKIDQAIESLNNAIKYRSTTIGASHNNLGVVLALKGDFSAALRELERAEKLSFAEAENNLRILRKAIITNDQSLMAKLTFKEKNDE